LIVVEKLEIQISNFIKLNRWLGKFDFWW